MAVAKAFTTIPGGPWPLVSMSVLKLAASNVGGLNKAVVPVAYHQSFVPTRYFPHFAVCSAVPHVLLQMPAGVCVNKLAPITPTKVFFGPWRATGFPPVYKTLEVVTAMMGPQTPRKFPVLPFARS